MMKTEPERMKTNENTLFCVRCTGITQLPHKITNPDRKPYFFILFELPPSVVRDNLSSK